MKTLTSKLNANDQLCNLRLDRMENEIQLVIKKLHSYHFEPCTNSLYERHNELEQNWKKLKEAIRTTQDLIKLNTVSKAEITKITNEIINQYNKFMDNSAQYFSTALQHH